MDSNLAENRRRFVRWGAAALVALLVVGVAGSRVASAAFPTNTPFIVSEFQDVPDTSPFVPYLNNLYLDGIISGYSCGGVNPPEPCVPPGNKPYYRPNSPVTRLQMTKFIDNGRRNISNALGKSLNLTTTVGASIYISNTVDNDIFAFTNSGNDSIHAECMQDGLDCYSFHGRAGAGNYAAYLEGGRGVHAQSSDANHAGVTTLGSGAGAYGADIQSSTYRAAYAKANNTLFYGLYVDNVGSTVGSYLGGDVTVQGNLTVTGAKTGYVVDVMQNAGTEALEPGDVVTIVGNSPAVLGQIPVVTVKKAASAYDTGVVGIVDQAVYVPDAATKAAYDAQEQGRRDAASRIQQAQAAASARSPEAKADLSGIVIPEAKISDAEGALHAIAGAAQVPANGYTNVVTLGSYKAVKVDASYGAIKAGDLLTSSPHAGYAMKVTDKAQSGGAVIGKALGSLDRGTGTVPVMVTLK